jgi:anti-anti-sigma factor
MALSTGPDAPSAPRMTVTLTLGEPSVIVVTGEVDLDGAGPLRHAVDAALDHHPHLVFNLEGVTFADSTFLSTLLLARCTAQEREGSVRLQEPSATVHRLLELTGALELFPVITTGQLKQP